MNSGPIISRLWTKVHETLIRCMRALVVFKRLSPVVYVLFRSEDIRQ